MQFKRVSARCVLVVLPCLLSAGSVCPAQAPLFDFGAVKSQDRLTEGQSRQLAARIDYWLKDIRQKETSAEVLRARDSLLKDFAAVDKSFYQNRYATLVAEKSTGALEGLEGELKHLKEVSIVLALSQMPTVTIQPALEKMIVHPNPAVRYHAWRGYRNIRSLVLVFSSGSDFDKKMYRSMRQRAKEESSAAVLAAIFQMIQMPPVRPPAVNEQDYMAFQQSAYEILSEAWVGRCRDVLDGDAGMADAGRRAVKAAENFALVFRGDRAKRTAILQMVVDMAWCAAKAYDGALKAVRQAERAGQRDEPAERAREASAMLLRDCENALSYLTEREGNYIWRALASPGPDPGAAVGLGVVEWINVLKAQGVASPAQKFAAKPAVSTASAE